MTKLFPLSSSLTRLIWALGMVFAMANTAQAQLFTVTGVSPTVGPSASAQVGQPIVITITNLTAPLVTPNTVVFTNTGSNVSTSTTSITVDATSTIIRLVVPALTDGTYTIDVQLTTGIGAGLTLVVGSTNPAAFTFIVNNNAPLPVQLTNFTAENAGNSARLRWATANEKDNDHFDVEASSDGRTFARLGQVAGHGSTLLPQQYAFTDENLARYATSLIYYRLRQVDGDGTSSYSQVRTVAVVAGDKPGLVLYPTVAVAGEATHYAYAGAELAAGVTLEIYSLTGQRMFSQPLGEGTGTLASQALTTGWYWVRLVGAAPVRFYRP